MHTIESLVQELQSQTELAERLRQQAETLEAERDRLSAELEEWRFTNKVDELGRTVDRLEAELRIERAALADAVRHVGNLKDRVCAEQQPAKRLDGYYDTDKGTEAPQQHAQAALSDEQLDEHINAVLRPSGTKIANYTIQKNRDDMRAAMRSIIALYSQQSTAAPAAPTPTMDASTVAGFRVADAAAPAVQVHPDDAAVDRFAKAMKQKMAVSRDKGRGGWNDESQCSMEKLAQMLVDHIAKGDPVDIGNFAMMLHQREAEAVEHHPCNGGAARKALANAALASQESKGARPDAYVPIHPRTNEALWANTISNLDLPHPSYEMRPVFFAPAQAQPVADAAITEEQLVALLPGTYYMDPPDGGSITLLEQLQRMAVDASYLRWMCERGAHISHSMDGEVCNVWLPAERDGTEERPAEGWPQKVYGNWREAIAAAIRSLTAKPAQ